jgi:hypothetical protein
VIILVLLALTSCVSTEKEINSTMTNVAISNIPEISAEMYAKPIVGDYWVFEMEGLNIKGKAETTRKVVAIDGDLTIYESITKKTTGEYKYRETRDKNLNLIESGDLLYIPNLDLFRLPLTAGKREYSIERKQIDRGRMIKMKGVIEVFPPQKVQTMVGDFDAFEVKAVGRYIEPKTGRFSRYQTRTWFAPAVGFFIKLEHFERNVEDNAYAHRTKYELKSYDLQPR